MGVADGSIRTPAALPQRVARGQRRVLRPGTSAHHAPHHVVRVAVAGGPRGRARQIHLHAVMRQRSSAIIILCVLAATVAIAQQAPVFTPFGALPVLDSYLEALRKQAGIPGLSAAVVRDGVVIWEKGYGYQNTASRIPATPDTPYLVGDLSGTLAAAMLLECAERRQLYLDDPIRKYGVELPEAGVTIRQLLSHTNPALEEPFAYSPERYAQLTGVMEKCEIRSYRKSAAVLLDQLAMRDSVPGTDLWQSDTVLREGEFDSDGV